MQALKGKNKKSLTRGQRIRKGLLAKIHIAKKELCLDDDLYREILQREYGVPSAGVLRIEELEGLVRYFESKGWQGLTQRRKDAKGKTRTKSKGQVEALRERARVIAGEMERGEKRLTGLVKKICGVERLEWAGEAVRLKRLLAVLESIKEAG